MDRDSPPNLAVTQGSHQTLQSSSLMASRRAEIGTTERRQGALLVQQPRSGARKSERLSRLQTASKDRGRERAHSTIELQEPSSPLKRRKRSQEAEPPVDDVVVEPSRKSRRPLIASHPVEQQADQEALSSISQAYRSHISHWSEKKNWPREFFSMDPLLARKLPPSIRRKRSESSITNLTQSDQKPREEKSAPYENPSYKTLLEAEGNSYMREYEQGIRDDDEILCQKLLDRKQLVPKDTIFRDDVFRATCNRLEGKNEARIFKDITPLIVPFAENLAILGAKHLQTVVESVNEGWNTCIPITKPRPQPDYALGFGKHAFSDDQLHKLQPFIGDPSDLSYFRVTYYMYFPFLTAEVKCGTTGLDIADRQNSHSLTVAMNGVVQLFKRVGREKELHRRILGFSYSHDDESARIWGHYPVISKSKITFWRHSVRKYYFTERDGAEKWVAYTFTMNTYDLWIKSHLELIRSAIDDLRLEPDVTPQEPEIQMSKDTGVSQHFADQELDPEVDTQPSHDLQQATPDTSTDAENPAPRKKKKT